MTNFHIRLARWGMAMTVLPNQNPSEGFISSPSFSITKFNLIKLYNNKQRFYSGDGAREKDCEIIVHVPPGTFQNRSIQYRYTASPMSHTDRI